MSAELNPSYINVREDLLGLIPNEPIERVLDLGCATGATGGALKQRRPGTHVTGIELDAVAAAQASERLDRVIVGDGVAGLETLRSEGQTFDLILCGDVLEHLADPWSALRTVRQLARKYAIVSLPNVAHYTTIFSLLFAKRFPYRDRGIHDRTHLRFFAERNLPELFAQAGLQEVRRKVQYRLIERPHPLNRTLEPVLRFTPGLRGLTAFQFLSLLKPLDAAAALPPA